MEITKQNLYRSVEDLGRIYVDHMRVYYGTRYVQIKMIPKDTQQPLGMALPGDLSFNQPFDFGVLSEIPLSLQLDVGASAYWSEIASMQTLDNLLMQNKIDLLSYLERIPNGYIAKKQELIERIKAQQQPQLQTTGTETPKPPLDTSIQEELPTGKGYSALQRSINETGVVR